MFSSSLASFLMSNDRFAHDVLREANGYVKAFRFSTSLKDFGTDYNIVLCCQMMRYALESKSLVMNFKLECLDLSLKLSAN